MSKPGETVHRVKVEFDIDIFWFIAFMFFVYFLWNQDYRPDACEVSDVQVEEVVRGEL